MFGMLRASDFEVVRPNCIIFITGVPMSIFTSPWMEHAIQSNLLGLRFLCNNYMPDFAFLIP